MSAQGAKRAARAMLGAARVMAAAAACAVAWSAGAAPPLFQGLGVLPGGTSSGAVAVTANGSAVVGYSATPFGDRAFRWTRLSGMQSLGTLAGDTGSRAAGVSADGLVVVGYGSSIQTASYRAFRWTSAGGMNDLGLVPGGTSAVANGVSADGSVVVGSFDTPNGDQTTRHAFRWTTQSGMEDLGTMGGGVLSAATAINADASVIVGVADSASGLRAFRRTDQDGMINLGVFPGSTYTAANGLSADGAAIVGYGYADHGFSSFRWTGYGGMEEIGRLPGATDTIAQAVSADGKIVVGRSESAGGETAFIWTPALGLVDLNSYLLGRGLELDGWTLTIAYAISADGLTIVGVGNHEGHEEAWMAFLGGGMDLSPIEQLGKSLMSDTGLSSPAGQSCISCHAASAGFTNPISFVNEHGAVHRGADPSRFGKRKPPTAAYAGQSPILHLEDGTWVGGVFFDGHAPGWTLGDPLAEQALAPFISPVEQNNPDIALVVSKVAGANYASLFRDVWGQDSLPPDGSGDASIAYERIARSIAAYERSREVNPFNSKYDDYLAGRVTLTPQELRGLNLFNGVAGCAACHPSGPGPNGEPPLFTDFTYDNIGIPKNPENPFYTQPPEINPDGPDFVDLGLGGFLQQVGYPAGVFGPVIGKHKVSTLRNVDRRPEDGFVRSYGHNGFFKSLEEIVHFYNTRDVEAWPPPEVPQNMNIDELGNLHLTADEEAAVVAFMRTLTDKDVSPVRCPADFDQNGFVNGEDFDAFMRAFEFGAASADFDHDGFVTGTDFDLFSLAFDAGC